MCRRVTIDCTWDDEHADEDASEAFNIATLNELQPEFEDKLRSVFENNFAGGVTITVAELPVS